MSRPATLSVPEITTDRLVLRKARVDDRSGFIELQTDPEVRTYLGGPRPRSDVEQYLDAIGLVEVTSADGVFVVADKLTNHFLGSLMLVPRSAELPGHLTEGAEELELTYLLRRSAWGAGFAFEAASAALRSAAGELPDQPVIVITQSANQRSRKLATRLGFRTVASFEAYGAEQTLAAARLASFDT